jgi:choline dehydrogenase-like flavoprotein
LQPAEHSASNGLKQDAPSLEGLLRDTAQRVILDARRSNAGESVEADLCIIGGGAAAIPIALAFADTATRVVMLEGGGLASDPGKRGIYRVVTGSRSGVAIDRRKWHFGGNTNHWFGNCRPLEEADFEARDWIPHSGWPIERKELLPFYAEAQRLCSLGDFDTYDVERCRPYLSHQPLALRPDVLANRVVQTASSLRFAELYRERLESAENVRVFLHTRALELETNAAGDAVGAAQAVAADGRRSAVRARAFVLAAGGIENARLLLCSDKSNPHGLGNDHDVLGRYFMEHPFIDVPLGRNPFDDLHFYSSTHPVGAATVWGHIVLAEEIMRRERLPGACFWFPSAATVTTSRSLAGRLRDLVLGRERVQNVVAELRNAAVDVTAAIAETARRTNRDCGVRICLEQVPDPQNRVRLVPRCDGFGQRRVAIDFRLTEVARQARAMTIAMEELGLDARRIVERMLLRIRAGRMGFFWHHLGTTRMHRDPAHGVVDADCRVHGMRNLFVAGGSVFPTGGTAAPTLTIVALAVRLAEHIRRRGL